MTIDRVEIARDDAARADKKREPQRDDRKPRTGGEFLARYQEKVRIKESEPKKDAPTDPNKKKEPGKEMLSRIIQVFKGKEEEQGQGKSELKKKEEEKKEKTRDGESKTETKSDDDHTPLRGKASLHQEKGGGGGEGGGSGSGLGSGAGGGGGSPSGGGGGGTFQSSTSSRDPHSGGERGKGGLHGREAVRPAAFSSSQEGKGGGGGRHFRPKILDELVLSVSVGVNQEGEGEMTVQLSDEFYSGLKLTVTKGGGGVVVTFHCPNREVKNTFLFERPRIYSALKEKKVAVTRIDVI